MPNKQPKPATVVEMQYRDQCIVTLKHLFFILVSIALILPLNVAQAGVSETAKDLTTLLRAARAVTVNKTTIADPGKINVRKFIKKTKKNYLRASGKKFDKSNEVLNQLMKAIKFVVSSAQEGKYQGKWPSGPYANKFLPARFARETGLKFAELTGGKGILKLTTSNALLVNQENKVDTWENTVIENKFLKGDWPRNQIFAEKTADGYRLILPEYYKSGCLGCHGGEMGKKIHSKPIAGNLGDFGGAISVILKE
ncbi:DUF3365 domain-containing protein [Beggiatoa alba]|nr:DUF3365 domain-containing protein [Beggiatoa alba]